MWTHRDLFFGALGGGGYFCQAGPARTPDEVADRLRQSFVLKSIPLPPLMHAAATWATLCGMFAGSPVVLDPARHFDPVQIFDLVEREKIQSITIVGDAMARPLLDALEANPGRWNLAHVLSVGSGGAVFSQHLQDGLKRFMPNARIMSSIGSSEGGTFGTGPRGNEGFMTLAGRPDLAVVVDRSRLAEAGEMGILARVGHIPRGYWGDPAKTAATFVEFGGRRYALTGDQARLEPDGSIVVFGRGSTCINTGGEKVFPEEVEEVLRRHQAVLDALVVGTPDPRWGEAVTAVVAIRPGVVIEEETLRVHCRGALAGYKIPKHVVRVASVVRSPAGKADYGWAKKVAIAALDGPAQGA
jgi:fatty-acyl-CoA synthase